tara:strand:- start:137 stop:394 length:258 start_codon:yes stop_codon:yes gene_type:complete
MVILTQITHLFHHDEIGEQGIVPGACQFMAHTRNNKPVGKFLNKRSTVPPALPDVMYPYTHEYTKMIKIVCQKPKQGRFICNYIN